MVLSSVTEAHGEKLATNYSRRRRAVTSKKWLNVNKKKKKKKKKNKNKNNNNNKQQQQQQQ